MGFFDKQLHDKKLMAEVELIQKERGHHALNAYLQNQVHNMKAGGKAEFNFKSEGVVIGVAILSGKIDSLEIDSKNRTITVVDYKTGKPYRKWDSSTKLRKYRQQLYVYKLLVEGSATFKGYTVGSARLDFIEPFEDGSSASLMLNFKKEELEHITKLLQAVWQHIQKLNFPSTEGYAPTSAGMLAFEEMLISTLD